MRTGSYTWLFRCRLWIYSRCLTNLTQCSSLLCRARWLMRLSHINLCLFLSCSSIARKGTFSLSLSSTFLIFVPHSVATLASNTHTHTATTTCIQHTCHFKFPSIASLFTSGPSEEFAKLSELMVTKRGCNFEGIQDCNFCLHTAHSATGFHLSDNCVLSRWLHLFLFPPLTKSPLWTIHEYQLPCS